MGNTIIPMIAGLLECVGRVSVAVFLPRAMGEYGLFYAEWERAKGVPSFKSRFITEASMLQSSRFILMAGIFPIITRQ